MATPYAGVLGRAALIRADLLVAQGADNAWGFVYKRRPADSPDDPFEPVDLTGWTARMQMRRRPGAVPVWATLTEDDGITLGADGRIVIFLPASATESWEAPASREDLDTGDLSFVGQWDLELTDTTGAVLRFAEGRVQVDADVTRSA